jgi:hypothetical protein
VSALARRGSLEQVNAAIDNVIQNVNAAKDTETLDAMEDVRLQQALFYRGQVRNNQQLQADLGVYAKNIF